MDGGRGGRDRHVDLYDRASPGGTKDPAGDRGSVVRFHVKANSDTRKDQDNKLAVRDALLEKMEELLDENSDSDKEETEKILRRHLPELETCAEKVLRERNCSQSVEVSFGESWFPQKTYGEYTFPSGNYEALKVTIGEGDGHNWWCMLYPSMCFPDAFHAVPDEEGRRPWRRC